MKDIATIVLALINIPLTIISVKRLFKDEAMSLGDLGWAIYFLSIYEIGLFTVCVLLPEVIWGALT